MKDPRKIGIIICDRWRRCAGGKCLRALRQREGAFARYEGEEVELAGYTTCDGCPGGNIEYAPAEMKKNGVEVVHLATGLLVGYPPCPYIDEFKPSSRRSTAWTWWSGPIRSRRTTTTRTGISEPGFFRCGTVRSARR